MKLVKLLRAIAYSLKAEYEAASAFSHPDFPTIIIYQMGKVGSSTVYKSLREASLSNPILHLHFLSQDLSEHRRYNRQAGVHPPPYHVHLGEATRKQLNRHQDFPIKVVSLVRDPIAFTISYLFENPRLLEQSVQTDTGSVDPEKAVDCIHRRLGDPNSFAYMYEWFDKELKTVFGIHVFANPFPLETGYAVYFNANVEATGHPP